MNNPQLKTQPKGNKLHSALTLHELQLKVYLGVTALERATKQTVLISLKISFFRLPLGCSTGNLSDTVCYASLTQKIKKFIQDKKFTLVENLGKELFGLIKKALTKNCKLSLAIAKQHPIDDLRQSIFEISE